MAGPDILGERQSGQDVRTQNGTLSQPPLKNLLLHFFFFLVANLMSICLFGL